ncbi:PAS domain-containing sensor histidine kinase [Spirochaetia bacterium]|nr:PAS domain-containing sensor histidine kinase [Spirochaetia bacterium]
MTIFKKSLLTLGLSALGLSAVLVVLILAFMNSLYYEINAQGLRNTAKTVFSLIGENRITAYFAANAAASGSATSAADAATPGTVTPGGDFSPGEIFVPGGAFSQSGELSGGYRLTLIDTAGNVLWDSQVEGELVNHIDREEVRAALAGREGSARRDSISTGMRRIYWALPVYGFATGADDGADGKVTGVFRLSLAVPGFWQRISAAAPPFFLFAGLLVLAAFAAIFVFSRSLSASLGRLVGIAHAAAGRPWFNSEPSNPGAGEAATNEFLTLEKALRGMAAELNRRIEQARAEGGRLEAILNGMSEAVFATDGELALHLVNPRARELFDLGERDKRGISLLEATHSADLEETAKTVLETGRPLEMELKLHSGQETRFQVFAAPLSAGSKGVVLVLQDITRLVRLEQVRKDFVANVSHELRTPIQLIKGFSESLLESSFEDKEQMLHFIEIIRKNAGTMENLTNDLLILASLENGDSKAHDMEDQSLAPLFAEAVSSVEVQAKKKQIEITVNCPADLTARLHGSFIIQAFINLLDNSIKYSPPASRVWACARKEKDELILEVRDEGIGIPAEHLERIFERFYRARSRKANSAGSRTEGTGLGLSIVRHICLLHKGRAEVESHAGEGSIFRMIIPS